LAAQARRQVAAVAVASAVIDYTCRVIHMLNGHMLNGVVAACMVRLLLSLHLQTKVKQAAAA